MENLMGIRQPKSRISGLELDSRLVTGVDCYNILRKFPFNSKNLNRIKQDEIKIKNTLKKRERMEKKTRVDPLQLQRRVEKFIQQNWKPELYSFTNCTTISTLFSKPFLIQLSAISSNLWSIFWRDKFFNISTLFSKPFMIQLSANSSNLWSIFWRESCTNLPGGEFLRSDYKSTYSKFFQL
ncbi:hypothetical protein BpHYR1_023537 [Brachionus plicatilis]|uniref:Uncharacterized protein n=1 Tax=Brachionus plicatilis TaxID=10195 RepID=A0A3M7Q2T0_BRAPC|nr:hypothetical protein BpHYR1_023537 [Brachionus plicatilis]